MCLNYIKGPFIADSDIICYKVLKEKRIDYVSILDDFLGESDNAKFTAIIDGKVCSGKLFKSFDGNYYLFQNVKNGTVPMEFEKVNEDYIYSWYLDSNVSELTVNDVLLDSLHPKTFVTLYQETDVENDKIYKSEIKINAFNNDITKALHSFITKEAAIIDARRRTNTIVVECIIPKGSKYYKGLFNSIVTDDSYASDTLQYPKFN